MRKCPTNVLRILNLDIEQQSERYKMDNHFVGNKYVAQHHLEVLATMLENENEENLSKLGLSKSVHESKVQSDDQMTYTRPHQTFTVTFC